LNLTEDDISELVTGCINNDRRAQERLYRNYYKVMMNLCLRYCEHDTDALAVLNLAFFKAFKNIGQFDRARGQLYTWIRKIVINECFNHLRLEKGKLQAVAIDTEPEIKIEPSIFEKIAQADLLSMVHRLPPATRAVFNLYIMEGFGHKEVAELLGISEGTSKWHLNDARKKLQSMILNQKNDT
jgi:RNA polymerase sigma factor (sigma-70 family)